MDNYRHLIANGKLKEVLEGLLLESSIIKKEKHELILIQSKLVEIESRERKGIIKIDEILLEKQKISDSILNLVSDLENRKSQAPQPKSIPVKRKRILLAVSSLLIILSAFIYFKPFQKHTSNIPYKGEITTPPPSEQEEIANQTNDTTFEEPEILIDTINYPMVLVKTDTFIMGDAVDAGADNERPAHPVYVDPYYIGKYEITQFQWMKIMDEYPSHRDRCLNCPVENITWNEIQDFINKLNSITDQEFKLPTEAEWEFSARGGLNRNEFLYAGTNSLDSLSKFAWHFGNASEETKEVGSLSPNELGLYDMNGNVYEFCQDWYAIKYYTPEFCYNPKGPETGMRKTYRGGAYDKDPKKCLVTRRNGYTPTRRCYNIGFRLVLNAQQ